MNEVNVFQILEAINLINGTIIHVRITFDFPFFVHILECVVYSGTPHSGHP